MTDSEKLDLLLEKVDTIDGRVSCLGEKVGNLASDMHEVKQKVTKIELSPDNEIRVNIQRVAEGHLDLSRNLHEAMKPNNELEMLTVRVEVLESDVKEPKQKIS